MTIISLWLSIVSLCVMVLYFFIRVFDLTDFCEETKERITQLEKRGKYLQDTLDQNGIYHD